jgi:hypothetical protein
MGTGEDEIGQSHSYNKREAYPAVEAVGIWVIILASFIAEEFARN